MKKTIQELETYLHETLGVKVRSSMWEKDRGLPQFLRVRYSFFKAEVLGLECIWMVDLGDEEVTPANIAKHLAQARTWHDAVFVYVCRAITSHNRKRLIEQKVPFVVPRNQLYLPFLGIELREHLKRLHERKTVFSPSTQVLLLGQLWRKDVGVLTPTIVAERYGYTKMTMSRAFDELEAAEIGEYSVQGKERRLRFIETGQTLWERVLPYLTSPVRKRVYVGSGDTDKVQKMMAPRSGVDALAQFTQIAEPEVSVFAVESKDWSVLKGKLDPVELAYPEPDGSEIEIWNYAPGFFSDQGAVDRLSLYLTLKNNTDERIQFALEELLEGMTW